MIQGLLVIAVVVIAILVGQAYPFIGGLIATFPIKIVAFAAAEPGGDLTAAVTGLTVGAFASFLAAVALLLSLKLGLPIALVLAIGTWMGTVAVVRWMGLT